MNKQEYEWVCYNLNQLGYDTKPYEEYDEERTDS